MLAVLLHTDNPSAAFETEAFVSELEPGTQATLPPGYKATQIQPQHPGARYEDFLKSKLREMGRPLLMPYLKVAADAAGHNYSSGRLDLQDYQSGCEEVRTGNTDMVVLNRYFEGRWSLLPERYNHFVSASAPTYVRERSPMSEAVFLHFLGRPKPWQAAPLTGADARRLRAFAMWEAAWRAYAFGPVRAVRDFAPIGYWLVKTIRRGVGRLRYQLTARHGRS